MARTPRRQREVETMHTHNMNLRSRLRELCQAVEKGEIVTARRLAQSAMAYLDRGTVPADAIYDWNSHTQTGSASMSQPPDHFWDFMEDGNFNKFAESEAEARKIEIAAAALLKLVEYGVPPDTQELLTYGNKRAGVRPGALVAALSAAFAVAERQS